MKDIFLELVDLFKTNRKFKVVVLFGFGIILTALVVLIVFAIINASIKPPETPEVIQYRYNDPVLLTKEEFNEFYTPIAEVSTKDVTYFATILVDYYEAGINKKQNSNFKTKYIADLRKAYKPKYASNLNSIFKKNNQFIDLTFSKNSGKNCLKNIKGNCYSKKERYLYDAFVKLSNKDRIITDMDKFISAVKKANITGTYSYGDSITSKSEQSFNNFANYYVDFKIINLDDTVAIASEFAFYESLADQYYLYFDKINFKNQTSDKHENLKDYLTERYQKYVHITPKYYKINGKNQIVDFEVSLDFVSKRVDNYHNLIKGSEIWEKSDIQTKTLNLNSFWEALTTVNKRQFIGYTGNIYNFKYLDYTTLFRNQTEVYNPILQLETDKTMSYPLEEVQVVINGEKDKSYNIIAKKIYDVYYKRALDLFATELKNNATLSYEWEYVYNDALSKVTANANLKIDGFAVGILVKVYAKDKNGVVLKEKTIELDKDITIRRNDIVLK